MSKEINYTSIVYDITKDNVVQKLTPHFSEVIKMVGSQGFENIKLKTSIKELSSKEAVVDTKIEEEIRKMLSSRKK